MLRRGYYILGQRLLRFDDPIFTISFHFHLRCTSSLLCATKVSLIFISYIYTYILILTLCNEDNIVLSVASV